MKRTVLIFLSMLLTATPAFAQTANPATGSGFSFISLEVADMARAQSFYVDGLGMKPVFTVSKPGDSVEEIAFNFSGNPRSSEPLLILIHHRKPDATQNHSTGAKVGIRVSDSRAAALRMQKAGFAVIRIASADEKGPVINSVVRDADGVIVELVELRMP
jgi:catechol 2,3-dioxygenase-like lactoylglutathione lyase family enzyme